MRCSRRDMIVGSLFGLAATQLRGTPARASSASISVRDFGAAGDGKTDDRAAFVAAVKAARGRRVEVPEGNYLINTDTGPITLEEVALVGANVLDGDTTAIDRGTNLWITGRGNNAFKVRRGTSVSGLGVYYPHQRDTSSPQPYPATFTFDFSNGAVQFVKIERVVVFNAWGFIDINDVGGNVGHVELVDNYVCALNRGIYLRRNTEHIRIERNNFTFGHWLAATERGARGYMRANATAIQLDESDGVEISDNLIFGHLNGVMLSSAGLCQFIKVVENKFDQVRYGLRALGGGRFDGQVLGNTFNSFDATNRRLEGRSISIETQGAGLENLIVSGNSFDSAANEHVYVTGEIPHRRLIVGPNNYRSWAIAKTEGFCSAIGINARGTDAQITGGWFDGSLNPEHSYGVAGKLDQLQVTGASFDSCAAALYVDANEAVITGNHASRTRGAASDMVIAKVVSRAGNSWDKPSRA